MAAAASNEKQRLDLVRPDNTILKEANGAADFLYSNSVDAIQPVSERNAPSLGALAARLHLPAP